MLSARANELLSDSDCLRFLRARDHNAKKAADMIHHWEDWWHTPLPGTGTGTDAGNGTGTDAGNGAGSGRESEKSNLAVRPKDSARVADPNGARLSTSSSTLQSGGNQRRTASVLGEDWAK